MSFNESKQMFSRLDSNTNFSLQFFNFVFTKISNKQVNRFIEKDHFSITIIPASHPPIKVIPLFKNMDKDNLVLQHEIDMACDIIENSEIKYIYFVYPKNKNFDKHIEVRVPKLEDACGEYMIKVIPYSLNDLYKKGKINGNCNILCK